MYRSVLVPLDGSTLGECALPLAASIARCHGARLQVVRVHVTLVGVYGEAVLTFDETLDRKNRENEIAYLNAIVERLQASAGVPASCTLLDGVGATVAEAVCQHARTAAAGLLIMTTHGRGPLARFWLGSVADALVRQAPIPILLVRPQEAEPDRANEPVLRQVLIPLDGSELAEQIIEPATELGAAMQAEYTLLQIVKPVVPLSAGPTDLSGGGADASLIGRLKTLHEQMEADARRYLETVAERLRAKSLTVQTRVVFHDQPAMAILDDAGEHAIDLIALATRGQGGLGRLLLGSVADKVLRGSKLPVLVHCPKH